MLNVSFVSLIALLKFISTFVKTFSLSSFTDCCEMASPVMLRIILGENNSQRLVLSRLVNCKNIESSQNSHGGDSLCNPCHLKRRCRAQWWLTWSRSHSGGGGSAERVGKCTLCGVNVAAACECPQLELPSRAQVYLWSSAENYNGTRRKQTIHKSRSSEDNTIPLVWDIMMAKAEKTLQCVCVIFCFPASSPVH